MKLYDFAFSPNARKVRAVAYELGLGLETHHVDLVSGGGRDAAYLAINPNGRVPTLVDGDFVLWESNAIMRYLSARSEGAKGRSLLPKEPRALAEVDRWLAWHLAHLGPAISKVTFERIVRKLVGAGEPDQAAIEAGSAEFARLTAILDGALAALAREGRAHLAGELSVADFSLAAHYSLAPMGGLDITPFPHVGAWLERMFARDSMKRALADARAVFGGDAKSGMASAKDERAA